VFFSKNDEDMKKLRLAGLECFWVVFIVPCYRKGLRSFRQARKREGTKERAHDSTGSGCCQDFFASTLARAVISFTSQSASPSSFTILGFPRLYIHMMINRKIFQRVAKKILDISFQDSSAA
jgi:hypothetical protein